MTPHDRAVLITNYDAEDMVPIIRDQIEQAIAEVLDRIGLPAECRYCGARIWWVRHNNNKTAAYGKRGVIHGVECEMDAYYKKPHRRGSMFK